jgi:hypothetical protein
MFSLIVNMIQFFQHYTVQHIKHFSLFLAHQRTPFIVASSDLCLESKIEKFYGQGKGTITDHT